MNVLNETWKTNPALFRRQMCGLTRNAMKMIRARRATFVAKPKPSGTKHRDVVTDADVAVQAFFAEHLQAEFPGVGIIGEEGLFVPCALPGRSIYWTVDPLDGTIVFSERALHGFSVLLSLVEDGVVIAACIGDVMTGVIYWFAPGQDPVWEEPGGDPLPINGYLAQADETSLLIGLEPEKLPDAMRALFAPSGPFDRYDLDRGSLGLRFARLFSGNATAIAMRPGREWTPWDDTPLIGLCRVLGFRYLALEGGKFAAIDPPLVQKATLCRPAVLVVHESRLNDLRPWLH